MSKILKSYANIGNGCIPINHTIQLNYGFLYLQNLSGETEHGHLVMVDLLVNGQLNTQPQLLTCTGQVLTVANTTSKDTVSIHYDDGTSLVNRNMQLCFMHSVDGNSVTSTININTANSEIFDSSKYLKDLQGNDLYYNFKTTITEVTSGQLTIKNPQIWFSSTQYGDI